MTGLSENLAAVKSTFDVRLLMLAAFASGVVVTVVIGFWRHRSNRRPNNEQGLRCPECQYDLRASPTCCPECGSLIVIRTRYLAALAADLRGNQPDPSSEDLDQATLHRFHETDSPTEADLLERQLRSRGLMCKIARVRGHGIDSFGDPREVFEIWVAKDDVDSATEYLCQARGIEVNMMPDVVAGRRKIVCL